MKKYKLLIVALIAGFTSCADYLAEKPESVFDPETFYSNESTALNGLTGVYSSLRSVGLGSNLTFAVECWGGVGSTTAGTTFTDFLYTPSSMPLDPTLIGLWNSLYSAVNQANTYIYRIENMKDSIDVNLKNRMLGEAKCIRAIHYFYLVRIWGEVPLRIERPANFTDPSCPASTLQDIYSQILSDLTFAGKYCWDKGESRNRYVNDNGRVTRMAANALKAKVLLEIASSSRYSYNDRNQNYRVFDPNTYYYQAKQMCDSVINQPGFGLEADWANIWKPSNQNNVDILLAVQFAPLPNFGSSFFTQYVPKECTYNRPGVDGTKIISNSFYGQYKASPYFFNSRDNRFKAGVIQRLTEKTSMKEYPWNEIYSSYRSSDGTTYPISSTNPRTSKWLDVATSIAGLSPLDWPIIRSAEVYLIRSEILAELSGEPASGYDDYNKVRIRGMADRLLDDTELALYNNSTTLYSQMNFTVSPRMEQFREALIRERFVELLLEGHSWFDLKRLGMLEKITKRIYLTGNARIRNRLEDYYWPIPQDELDSNNKLLQKTGY